VIEISDKPGEEEAEPAFKVSDLHNASVKQLFHGFVFS